MDYVFKTIGQMILVAASIIMILVVMLDVARAADMDDCTYQRMVTAAAWSALDDAEQAKLPRAVVRSLEVDLEIAKELEQLTCRIL